MLVMPGGHVRCSKQCSDCRPRRPFSDRLYDQKLQQNDCKAASRRCSICFRPPNAATRTAVGFVHAMTNWRATAISEGCDPPCEGQF